MLFGESVMSKQNCSEIGDAWCVDKIPHQRLLSKPGGTKARSEAGLRSRLVVGWKEFKLSARNKTGGASLVEFLRIAYLAYYH